MSGLWVSCRLWLGPVRYGWVMSVMAGPVSVMAGPVSVMAGPCCITGGLAVLLVPGCITGAWLYMLGTRPSPVL